MSLKASLQYSDQVILLNEAKLDGSYENIINNLKIVQNACDSHLTKLMADGNQFILLFDFVELNGDPKKKIKQDNVEEDNDQDFEIELGGDEEFNEETNKDNPTLKKNDTMMIEEQNQNNESDTEL